LTGTISLSNTLAFCAAAAFCWLLSENASWSAREMEYFLATFSAVMPIGV